MKLKPEEVFIRRFPKYRTLEARCKALEKILESDAALIESLNRYIDTLEGRDIERVRRIDELESLRAESLNTINELRGSLSGIVPKTETPQ